jgi:hypothetical protein
MLELWLVWCGVVRCGAAMGVVGYHSHCRANFALGASRLILVDSMRHKTWFFPYEIVVLLVLVVLLYMAARYFGLPNSFLNFFIAGGTICASFYGRHLASKRKQASRQSDME